MAPRVGGHPGAKKLGAGALQAGSHQRLAAAMEHDSMQAKALKADSSPYFLTSNQRKSMQHVDESMICMGR